jgi:hypothetical protein
MISEKRLVHDESVGMAPGEPERSDQWMGQSETERAEFIGHTRIIIRVSRTLQEPPPGPSLPQAKELNHYLDGSREKAT